MFESAKTFLRSLRKNVQGNVMTLMGLSMVPLVGTVGLAVDGAQWITWKRELRSAADAGAIAGANALKNGSDVDTAVRRVLAHNTQRSYTINAIETPPTVGKFAGDTSMVRVVLSTQQALPFSSMFLSTAPMISVEAVAQASNEVVNCMIALAPSGTALSITGSASITMNCGLASNSDMDATASTLPAIRCWPTARSSSPTSISTCRS